MTEEKLYHFLNDAKDLQMVPLESICMYKNGIMSGYGDFGEENDQYIVGLVISDNTRISEVEEIKQRLTNGLHSWSYDSVAQQRVRTEFEKQQDEWIQASRQDPSWQTRCRYNPPFEPQVYYQKNFHDRAIVEIGSPVFNAAHCSRVFAEDFARHYRQIKDSLTGKITGEKDETYFKS